MFIPGLGPPVNGIRRRHIAYCQWLEERLPTVMVTRFSTTKSPYSTHGLSHVVAAVKIGASIWSICHARGSLTTHPISGYYGLFEVNRIKPIPAALVQYAG